MTSAQLIPLAGAPAPDIAPAMEAEFDRIAVLIRLAQRHRADKTAGPELKKALTAAQDAVNAARGAGLWQDLLGPDADLATAPFAADLLSFALYPHARPSACHVLTGLSPGRADPAPTQALVHELLMLSPADEIALTNQLSPAAPLVARRLLRIDGAGPLRSLAPGAGLMRRVLGAKSFSYLPAGMRLLAAPDARVPALVVDDDTTARLSEVTALAAHAARCQGADPAATGGPAMLFFGAPGTGKSLAARHLAARLSQPLFRLDLGSVVSKWVGETERNLSRVFDGMSGAGGCILIDEADALLGKRVSVKEGRDHYANVTVSHLLMLMEAHRGPVILTSNLRSNIDDAYIRRFAAVVEFRRPDKGLRQLVWQAALADLTPDAAALARLAANVDLSPAEIHNCTQVAAALSAGGPVDAPALARAVFLERTKTTQTFSPSDLRDLTPYLRRPS